MSDLRTKLAQRIEAGTSDWSPTAATAAEADDIVDAVLATSELTAIFDFLDWFAHRHGGTAEYAAVLRDDAKLPESVVTFMVARAWPGGES